MLKGIAHYERSHRPWATFFDDEARAEVDPHWLRSKKWHGVISRHTSPSLVQGCAELGLPLVDLHDAPPYPGVPKIRPDNIAMGHLGAEHLLERGFRHFGFCGFADAGWSNERRDGFLEALRLAGHPCDVFDVDDPIDLTPFWDANQTAALSAWLKRLSKPAAVMASNDMRAQQVASAAHAAGLLVPEEVAILGANNDPIRCELAEPPLSSVATNAFQSGYQAAEQLAQMMAGERVDVFDRRIEPIGVVTRQSTDILAVGDKNVAAAVSYIREHACHGITVDDVLKQAFASRSQLEKKFRTLHRAFAAGGDSSRPSGTDTPVVVRDGFPAEENRGAGGLRARRIHVRRLQAAHRRFSRKLPEKGAIEGRASPVTWLNGAGCAGWFSRGRERLFPCERRGVESEARRVICLNWRATELIPFVAGADYIGRTSRGGANPRGRLPPPEAAIPTLTPKMLMKRPVAWTRALVASSSLCLVAVPQLRAQSAPANPSAAQPEDEAVVLSPFVVEATEDTGYAATATLAGTRIRTELKDVGSSISVVTAKFLQDTNARNLTELMVYTPSAEVAGQGGNYLGQGASTYLTAAAQGASTQTRIRGLAQADNTRDFFLTDIPMDSYNVGRVDVQRGPNAILFGIGSPAGIVNTSLNQAAFRNSNEVENQVDNYGSVRFTADFNHVLLPQELAVRVSLLKDETKYRQDPAYKSDERVYAALRYDPSFLSKGSARTSLTANFEYGDIKRNDPINTPPLDAITPWFLYPANERARGFSAAFVPAGQEDMMGRYLGDGQVTAQSDPWLGAPGNRVFDGVVTAFNGAAQGASYPSQVKNWPGNGANNPANVLGANTLRGITTYNSYAQNAGLVGSTIGGFKSRSLTDPTIFDYYNHLLPGPNQLQFNRFNAFNAALRQTFLDDKVGFEVAYNRQESKFGQNNFLNSDATSIAIDIMRTLIDGTPNPNFLRPLVYAGPGSFGWTETTREDIRATAFAELDFARVTGKDSALARIFGRNVFTALYNEQKTDRFTGNGPRYFIDAAFPPALAAGAINQASRNNIFAVYLGGAVTGSTASGIGLEGIKNTIVPSPVQAVNYYNNETQSWQVLNMPTVNNDLANNRGKVYTGSRLTDDKVESSAIVWQGYWLDGTIIPMFGYREDKDSFRDAGNAPSLGQGMVDPFSPDFKLPANPIRNTVRSKTYSIVTHLPNSWRDRLPGRLDVSLIFNKSENFQPDSSRRDLLGNPVANPAGNTKEYGFAITALDDRLTLKVVRYETKVENATLSGNIGNNYYLIGAVETWGQAAAIAFKNSMEPGGPLSGPASTLYGYTSDGHQVTWHPDEPTPENPDPSDPNRGYSQAALDAIYQRQLAAVNAWLSPEQQVPESFQQAWGMSDYKTGGQAQNFGAAGVAVTGDTLSKGTEVELIANPIKGLDISINVSKTFATQTNLAKSYVDWINKRYDQFLNTPAGEMRLWGGEDDSQSPAREIYGASGETALGKFTRETMANYWLWQALEGSNVPELRPWRVNVTTNYAFQGGRFRGFNIGGAYRWQSEDKVGFPVIGTGTGDDPYRFDVNNPYEGSDEGIFDGWIGYQRKLTDRIHWRVQLNIRNIFATKDLQKVTVQPDGSPAGYRIPEPRTITLTNTISF